MANFTCPSCSKHSIPLKDKYAMGYWMTRRCRECHSVLCANAIILGVMTFAYLWNLLFFIGIAQFNQSWHYFGYMLVIWVVLDFINIKYVPLIIMRR